jgi:uncharacterized BrkB/YihY/UPF0761 family membrane protein
VIRLSRDIVRRFRQRKLLVWTTALAYSALWAVPPLVLLLLALAGFADLQSAWNDHLGPQIRSHVTAQTWVAVNSTVERIIGHPHVVWVLVGVVLAGWHVSGLVRAAEDALNVIFERRENRASWERIWTSIAVAAPVLVLVCLALLVVVGGRVIEAHGVAGALVFVARWLTAAALMWAVLAILIRAAPAARPRANAGSKSVSWPTSTSTATTSS